ncbi:ATP-binding protein [Tissierella sp. Yu-01]|uniref:sensor histidine kinase n=1 Tax=Tissierella sp. Yu-01 TaxID=3035694 RepID=UPI00240DF22C|nr:ATP-binding protein [Tissierella sp. Yu-01]WFA08352.1 ATP-binding protein [Tissierella sp. Yu-01]
MEKRIYHSLIFLTSIIIIITSVVLTLLFYDISKNLNNELNLLSLFIMVLPAVIGIMVLILVFVYIFSSKLTSKILDPIYVSTQKIESILSGEQVEKQSSYEELEPFVKAIQYQKVEIERSIDKLKESERYRREFTANVTHELKTPLTSINGYAEMIASGITDEEDTIKFANTILKEGTRLLGLIDQVLSLSKIEGQVIESKGVFEDIDLYEITKNIVSRFDQSIISRNIQLDFQGESAIIKGNRSMIEDLISNLIDNAIKYNKIDGKVELNISKKEKIAIINVKDTGMGIPDEDKERVFERFYRVDKSRSKKITGTGIGLSIVKHIVEYHKGNIKLNSEINKGTEIEIGLPIV